MKTLSILALIATTATPALAEFSPETLIADHVIHNLNRQDESRQR